MTRSGFERLHKLPLYILLFFFYGSAVAQESAVLSGQALVSMLRMGGFNLYFRHAATDWSQDDHVRVKGDWTSCDPSRIRQLSQEGRQTAREVGKAIRTLGIPVARVLASPYCRTVDTAKLMNLGPVTISEDIMNLRVADYFGGRGVIVGRAQILLALPPVSGTNTVIVSHGNLAKEATQVYPGESEGVVFRPRGNGKFDFVGRLTPAQWKQLVLQMPTFKR